MGELVKASLADADQPQSTEIPVQLNPTSLRLQMTNNNEGGKSYGRPVQQFQGSSSATLSMDLVFDSADEGTTGAPRSVREKTRSVARFVLPVNKGAKEVPPRVRFKWGDFVFDGIMSSLTEDIDLFSAEGVPLRAKVSISIKHQDPRFANLTAGPGSNKGRNATDPGGSGAGPGTSGSASADRTALAIGGESAAEFAARVGLDPAGWRGVTGGIDASLSLEAGAQINFSADASVRGGIGIAPGIEVDASATARAALGLTGSGAAGASVAGSTMAAGFALSAAGGVAAASAAAATSMADQAATGARQAFAAPGPSAQPPAAAVPAGGAVTGAIGTRTTVRRAIGVEGRPAAGASARAAGQSAPDPRATSFGFGVPLRPQVRGAAADRADQISGGGRVGVRGTRGGGPTTTDPTVPPWIALPAAGGRRKAVPVGATPPGRCGCPVAPAPSTHCRSCGGMR